MKRREFITLMGGAAATLPRGAHAQHSEQMRLVGVLMNVSEDDPEGRSRVAAFVQGLEQLGWRQGHNLRIDVRWGGYDVDRIRRYATELVASRPDVILANTSVTVAALQRATRTVPIVFAAVVDPVGAGFIESMAQPGGNTTGFIAFEYAIAAKWLELLQEIAPSVTRVAVMRDPTIAAGIGQFAAIQAVSRSGLQLSVISVQHDAEMVEQAVAAFARSPNGGLIVTASQFATNHLSAIPAMAARYKLPAVYPFRYYGGLICYGPDGISQFRPAAAYVDRILKGEKPAELPVQAPTKYELVINLKIAKALGLTVPDRLLSIADDVIE
jgi:putative tryptophan/tyrosine transport system substrate-binding protein